MEKLVTARLLSRATFDNQVESIMHDFNSQLSVLQISSTSGRLLMSMVRLSNIYSAVNTNAFQMTILGSDQYQVIRNYYPRHDNATFNNVSKWLFRYASRRALHLLELFNRFSVLHIIYYSDIQSWYLWLGYWTTFSLAHDGTEPTTALCYSWHESWMHAVWCVYRE